MENLKGEENEMNANDAYPGPRKLILLYGT
jgi:hypothetical protein